MPTVVRVSFMICAVLFSQAVFSNTLASNSLTIYTEQFMPYNYVKNEAFYGMNYDIVARACKKAKIQCVFKFLPWNRGYRKTKYTPDSGLISTARTDDRELDFRWVGPLLSGQNCIYKLSERSDISVNNQQQLKHYTIGSSKDSAYNELLTRLGFERNQNLILHPSKQGVLNLFASQRTDLLLNSSTAIHTYLDSSKLKVSDIEPILVIDSNLLPKNYLAINVSTAGKIVVALQRAIDEMREQNVLEKIRNDYVKPASLNSPNGADDALWRKCVQQY